MGNPGWQLRPNIIRALLGEDDIRLSLNSQQQGTLHLSGDPESSTVHKKPVQAST